MASGYHNVWKNFNKFLIRLDKRPQSWEEKVALYCGHLVEKGIQSSTLKSYITAIKKTLELIDYAWDENKIKFTTLTRACRVVNDRVKDRLPIQEGLLEIILFETKRYFDTQLYLQAMYQAMFTIAYFGLMRVGEITTGNHPVKARDIHVATNKDKKMLICLYTSKTHGRESRPQKIKIEGNFHINRNSSKKLYYDPYDTVQKFLEMRGDYENLNDPLFVFRDGTPVKPRNFRKLLKILLKNLNLDPNMYDTHSFRIGRATDMMKYGYSIDRIKQLGRWKSNAVYKYLR